MARSAPPPLARYQAKRDFDVTPEPRGDRKNGPPAHAARRRRPKTDPPQGLAFVIQKHWATRLHYDFRLELDGVLLSWAVPKGPSFDPADKRLAVHVEDHPLDYGGFEGTIPPRQYGAGQVIVWDRGTWEPVGDPHEGLARGKLVFTLHGEKLAGLWELVRTARADDRQERWMLFKKRDAWARPHAEFDVVAALPDSVVEHPLGPADARGPHGGGAASGGAGSAAVEQAGPAAEPDLALARKARLPARLEPQLATLAAGPPADLHTGAGWIAEAKFDGYRVLARVDAGTVRLLTRAGHDWTSRMPGLAEAVAELGIDSGWLDGEIVVLDEHGAPSFNLLQNALDHAGRARGRAPGPGHAIRYFVFDLPFEGGLDLRRVPLAQRRARLRRIFDAAPARRSDRVRYSVDFPAPPEQLLQAACQAHLEGIMLKRADAPYVSARTDTWLKLKCARRQEFVVCGYTDRANAPREVGSLLLGYHEGGRLRSAGSVGTGWDAATSRALHARLAPLRTATAPLDRSTITPGRWSRRRETPEVHWVEPRLVAEVVFGEWTPDGHIRHASFRALRDDKPPALITREDAAGAVPVPPSQRASAPEPTQVAQEPGALRVTHGDRVIDPSTGLKKIDLVRYYEGIAERMLPHLRQRPVSLVRAPQGIGGELFFQKHPETRMPGLRELDAKLWPGHAPLLAVDDAQGLVQAAQMNVVEFHTWNATTKRIDQPDRIVFDLDPGEGVRWAHVQEGALLVRTLLEEVGLRSWLKTSGGKGLHVVVPIAPRWDDDTVKGFALAVVRHLADTLPQRFVVKSGAANRVGRIFVDYLRNGRAQTTVAAFSARARPGLGMSMPVSWEQLADLKSGAHWTIATAREYLSFGHDDPWADFWTARQSLAAPMRKLAPETVRARRRERPGA